MATFDSRYPVDPLPENIDLLRRYCPGLTLYSHAQVAALIVIDHDIGCWHWPGTIKKTGYGSVSFPGNWDNAHHPPVEAHRYMFDTLVADIPYGLLIHHRCEVKDCWNPFHLEALTPKEHYARHHRQQTVLPWHPPVQLVFAFMA